MCILICFIVGCKVKDLVTNDKILLECQRYFAFIKSEVIENEDGWYEIKDMEKIYQEYDVNNFDFPFNSCLIGEDKNFLRKLLGEPHREAIDKRNNINTLIYCFSEKCTKERSFGGLASPGLIFFFNDKDQIKDCYVSLNLVGHYKSLDRANNRRSNYKSKIIIPTLQQDTIFNSGN